MYRELILAARSSRKNREEEVNVRNLFGAMDEQKANELGVTAESLSYNLFLIILDQLEQECGFQQAVSGGKCKCYDNPETGKMWVLGALSYIYDKYCPKVKAAGAVN